jgi:hypothetical protein
MALKSYNVKASIRDYVTYLEGIYWSLIATPWHFWEIKSIALGQILSEQLLLLWAHYRTPPEE